MIEKFKVVKIDYNVTDDDGTLVDTTLDDEPLEYMHGTDQILAALEAELEGKQVSERFFIRIEPQDAYGFRDESLVQTVDASLLDGLSLAELEVGMVINADSDEGELEVTIVDIQANSITVDGNHPLVDLALTFEGKVVAVRDASPQEIQLALIEAEQYQ